MSGSLAPIPRSVSASVSSSPSTLTVPGESPTAPAAAPLDTERYALLSRLGQGGVGEVHAAWDRVLERRVALKWLRPERARAGAEARLLREAQALARLSHPRVVAVHDVGSKSGRVFLAMEFIAGPTLGEWLAAEPRPWRRIVALFREAGSGLAAIHRAGLVHRDFKPSNVLIGPGERPLVTDLGLACSAGPQDQDLVATTPEPSALAERLTVTGTVLGTPAYMAPEQRRGEDVDARSDQFSFALALREALNDPQGVPRSLIPVLRRALADTPDQRFPTMDALLVALDRALGQRRRLARAAVLAIAATGAVALALSAAEQRAELCTGGPGRWQAVFGPAQQNALNAAFATTGRSDAGSLATRVATRLDTWGADWAAGHRQACVATRLAGEQSETLLDLRMACLDRRLQETGVLVTLLTQADGAILDRALPAVTELPDLARCADLPGLLSRQATPTDPALVKQIKILEGDVAAAQALMKVGRYDASLAASERAATAAHGTGWKPLVAEAEATLGEALARSGNFPRAIDTFQRVVPAALAGGDDRVLTESAASLAWMVAESGRFDEAHRALDLADGALVRMGGDLPLASRLANYRGEILRRQGRFAEAIAALRKAVALDRRQGAAVEPWAQATNLNNLAGALAGAGQQTEAITVMTEALARKRQVLEPDHPSLAASLDNLGTLLRNAGDAPAALPLLTEARTIRRSTLDPDHPDRLGGEINYGACLVLLGRPAEGLAVLDAALPAVERVSPNRAAHGHAWLHRGRALAALGREREARASLKTALEVLQRAAGPTHPVLALPLVELAELELRRGRREAAHRLAERALRYLDSVPPQPGLQRATVLFVLARSLEPQQREQAETLAREARTYLAGTSEVVADRRRAVNDWLAARRSS